MKTEKTAELHPDLEPPEGTIVQTGDEDIPTSEGGKQEDSLKAIYKKSRKDRSLVTRADEENNPDAEMVAKMVEESQDEGEFEHTATDAINLDERKEHGVVEGEEEIKDDEFVKQIDHDTLKAEQELDDDPKVEVIKEVAKVEKIDQKPVKDLDYEVNDGTVKAVIEGIEYIVPAADIESAGGLIQYQMNRAANIRFQKAATFGKALQKEREELAQQQHGSTAKGDLPDKDDLSEKAELVKTLREKVLDAALDGTESDVDSVIEELLASKKKLPAQTQDSPVGSDPLASDQVVTEYETVYKLGRAEANRMLSTDYSDIMDNKDLRKIAHSKYVELESDPRSVGRTAVEMAREAGDFVRRLSGGTKVKTTEHDAELAARRVKKRVLPQGSEARTRHVPTETKKPRSNKAYIQDIRRRQGNAS